MRQELFEYMQENHNITLVESEMQDIERIVSHSPTCSTADFKKLLVDYGNAVFDCGEDAGVDLEAYNKKCTIADEKRDLVIAAFESR